MELEKTSVRFSDDDVVRLSTCTTNADVSDRLAVCDWFDC